MSTSASIFFIPIRSLLIQRTPAHQRDLKRFLATKPGACFSKVPKLFGRISGDIILFVSSKRKRLEARNFAVIFIFTPFTTYEKTSFAGRSRTYFYEWLFGHEKFSGLSRNGPLKSRDPGRVGMGICEGRHYNTYQPIYLFIRLFSLFFFKIC